MAVTIRIDNPNRSLNRILNDDVKLFASQTWARYFNKYVPRDSSVLKDTYELDPGKVTYTSVYAHFQWEGRVMVGQNSGSPWARSREKKVYTNRNLQYTYPKATSHWEETAYKNDKAAVARQITNYLKSR
jgi:hypothetical protein